MITCRKCGLSKSNDNFYFRKDNNKYRSECKECLLLHHKEYYSNNKEKCLKQSRKYYKEHIEEGKKTRKEYYNNNKEKWEGMSRRHLAKFPWLKHFYAAYKRCMYKYNGSYKSYGAKGIKFNMTREEFKFLWFRDEAYNMEKPNIDRIDSGGNYVLENCRFLEQEENLKRRKWRKKS